MSIRILVFLAVFIVACATNSQLTKEEKKGRLLLEAGTNSLMAGETTDAMRALLLASEYIPQSPDLWNNLGLAYYAKNDHQNAKKSFSKAIKIDEKFSDAHNNLGAVYLEENQFKLAREELSKAAIDITYAKAFQANYNLALLDLKLNHPDEAEKDLNNALSNNRSYCPAYMKLAEISLKKNNTVAAIEYLQNASTGLCYGFVEAHYQLAKTYVEVHDFENAKLKFSEVVKQFPKTSWAEQAEKNLLLFK